jgi:hypothetical protein
MRNKGKYYADTVRRALKSTVNVGDKVMLRQERTDKLDTAFKNEPYQVTARNGNRVTIESTKGASYDRNVTHVKKYTERTCEKSEDDSTEAEKKVETTVPDKSNIYSCTYYTNENYCITA